ncbi:MAG: hypothetical protein RLY86_1487 [Pseudomonadota bacterium]|jgi:hypothetical protein
MNRPSRPIVHRQSADPLLPRFVALSLLLFILIAASAAIP